MRLKMLACCFLMLAFTSVCLAQNDKSKAHPDFGGSWILDASKSELGRGGSGQSSGITGTVTVTIKDAEFRLNRKLTVNGREREIDQLYYTDGRGETNPGILGSAEIKSKTKWHGSKIVSTSSTTRILTSGDAYNTDLEETWELSGDGKVLTDTINSSSSRGTARTIKSVYNRAP